MILNPVQHLPGNSGVHYSYVKSEKAQDEYGHPGYPQFTYKEPNGNLVSVTGAKELPKTECLDGSVAVQGMYYPLQMNVGDYFVVAQALAEKMLILSAKLIHKDSTKPDIS